VEREALASATLPRKELSSRPELRRSVVEGPAVLSASTETWPHITHDCSFYPDGGVIPGRNGAVPEGRHIPAPLSGLHSDACAAAPCNGDRHPCTISKPVIALADWEFAGRPLGDTAQLPSYQKTNSRIESCVTIVPYKISVVYRVNSAITAPDKSICPANSRPEIQLGSTEVAKKQFEKL
jgi:hypothetical protein